MGFPLVPKSTTLDDLELLQVQIVTRFCTKSVKRIRKGVPLVTRYTTAVAR